MSDRDLGGRTWTNQQQYLTNPLNQASTSEAKNKHSFNDFKHDYHSSSSSAYDSSVMRDRSRDDFSQGNATSTNKSSLYPPISYPINATRPCSDEKNATDSFANSSVVLKAVEYLKNSYENVDLDPQLVNVLKKKIEQKTKPDESKNTDRPDSNPSSSFTGFEREYSDTSSVFPFYDQYSSYELGHMPPAYYLDPFTSHSSRQKVEHMYWQSTFSRESGDPYHKDYANQSLDVSHYENRKRRRSRERSSDVDHYRVKQHSLTKHDEEKILALLSMSKKENGEFAKSQEPSSILLVMNLDPWIQDKGLWGAIHCCVRKYQFKPPFYIEKASVKFSGLESAINLALIAFPSVSAAETCIRENNYLLEIVGNKRHTSYKIMYFDEDSILFTLIGKFPALWKAVLFRRTNQRNWNESPERDKGKSNERFLPDTVQVFKNKDYQIEAESIIDVRSTIKDNSIKEKNMNWEDENRSMFDRECSENKKKQTIKINIASKESNEHLGRNKIEKTKFESASDCSDQESERKSGHKSERNKNYQMMESKLDKAEKRSPDKEKKSESNVEKGKGTTKRKSSRERGDSRHSRRRRSDSPDSRRNRSRWTRNRSREGGHYSYLYHLASLKQDVDIKPNNSEHQEFKLQETNKQRSNVDDIDGNEEDFWDQTKRVNPQTRKSDSNKTPIEIDSLSALDLKDPEFLLRVLLQTSIMIQNNQLSISTDPYDTLTPTDKKLIVQTLNEMELTSQEIIYKTLNDRNKFNAAESRVLIEALSNIDMFKAALLGKNTEVLAHKEENMEIDSESDTSEQYKNEKNIFVLMKNIKPFISKRSITNHITSLGLKFDFVKIYPISKNESVTSGFIKFNNFIQASELLKRTNNCLYLSDYQGDGIELKISDEIEEPNTSWTCKCSFKNSIETHICSKCYKQKQKLCDVKEVIKPTNKLILINFKSTSTIEDVSRVLDKAALSVHARKIILHKDSSNDKVCHFILVCDNVQSSQLLKKGIMENYEQFSQIRAGSKVLCNYVAADTPVGAVMPPQQAPTPTTIRVYTFKDVPRLAEYSASLYAKNEQEKIHYYQHYSSLYTQELVLGVPINIVLPEDAVNTASVSQIPNGTDGRQWPPPNEQSFTYNSESGYFYDHTTGLYFEKSSRYFYNMEIGKFLQYDPNTFTYNLVQTSDISSAPVKLSRQGATTTTHKSGSSSTATNVADPLKPEDTNLEKTNTPPVVKSKIHAKKVMKDLEKWSKSVQNMNKKKAPILSSSETSENVREAADVGFDILRKTGITKSTSGSTSQVSSTNTSLILENLSRFKAGEEEEEERRFVDYENLTCHLCHRVFNSVDILNKHSKLSDLHKNNLKQWYISKNLDPDNEENRKRQLRERSMKGNSTTSTESTNSVEFWRCATPSCMARKRSGYNLCLVCENAMDSRSQSTRRYQRLPQTTELYCQNMSAGNRLLKKMGWEQGTPLGKK